MSKSIEDQNPSKTCSGREIISLNLSNQADLQQRGNFLSKEISIKRKIKEVGNILHEIILENEILEATILFLDKKKINSILTINTSATVDIFGYLSRIAKFLELSEYEMIHILIIMDRILRNAELILSRKNVHKLLLVSSYIGDKMLKDAVYPTSYYSAVFGIPIKEIVELEFRCLEAVDYNILVSSEEFESYADSISIN